MEILSSTSIISSSTSNNYNNNNAGKYVETSDLLEERLKIKELLLLQTKNSSTVLNNNNNNNNTNEYEYDIHWWNIPSNHFDKWCLNRHGTLHGGLILALLFSLCKAHIGLYYNENNNNNNNNNNISISRVNIEYIRPIFTSKPLAVQTILEGNNNNNNNNNNNSILHAKARIYMIEEKKEPKLLCSAFMTVMREKTYSTHL